MLEKKIVLAITVQFTLFCNFFWLKCNLHALGVTLKFEKRRLCKYVDILHVCLLPAYLYITSVDLEVSLPTFTLLPAYLVSCGAGP